MSKQQRAMRIFTLRGIVILAVAVGITYYVVGISSASQDLKDYRNLVYRKTLVQFRPVKPSNVAVVEVRDEDLGSEAGCAPSCLNADYLRRLVEAIAKYGPKAIAIDIVIPAGGVESRARLQAFTDTVERLIREQKINFVFLERLADTGQSGERGKSVGVIRLPLHDWAIGLAAEYRAHVFFGYDKLSDDIRRIPWTIPVADQGREELRDSFAVAVAKTVNAALPVWQLPGGDFPMATYWMPGEFKAFRAQDMLSGKVASRIAELYPSGSLRDIAVLIGDLTSESGNGTSTPEDFLTKTPIGDVPGVYVQASFVASILSVYTLFDQYSANVAHTVEWVAVAAVFLSQRLWRRWRGGREVSLRAKLLFAMLIGCPVVYGIAVVSALFGMYLDFPVIFLALGVHAWVEDWLDMKYPEHPDGEDPGGDSGPAAATPA